MQNIGSGTVVGLGLIAAAVALLMIGGVAGWDPTWRAFGVTPLQPPFFDMHVINDYAACASKGVDAYKPQACNGDNYNIPPTWLWLGFLGLEGSDSTWLAAVIIAAAAVSMMLLFKGRSWLNGLIALAAILSPSVMMGVERGNLDLLILALVALAALIYDEKNLGRACGAFVFVFLGVVLKLVPIFCVALAARVSRRALVFTGALAISSLVYLGMTIASIVLIRRNAPTTFILSYGYETIFLGIDHIRSEAGLASLGLADAWVPALTAGAVVICAGALGLASFRNQREFCLVDMSAAGTAFLFGAGIYCGTYLLGTNFVYRLMFLLLCVPQLLDWQGRPREGHRSWEFAELALLMLLLGVLWSNGNANGHSIFLVLPQLLDWSLFFCLTVVLMRNFLKTGFGPSPIDRSNPSR